ncbi:MAG TPA: hypothetical protein VGP26_25420 [Actinophytocola sp.]|nr:hypothetical protein [Actinophytocola sp.]
MRATYAGGAAWQLTSGQGVEVAVNPAYGETVGTDPRVRHAFDPGRKVDVDAVPALDAVVLTGARRDQVDLPTLHQCDRRIPVLVSPPLPVAVTDAIELLGFVAMRLPLGHDHALGDLRVRFVPPGTTSSATVPDAGLLVTETRTGAGFHLRGDGPAEPVAGACLPAGADVGVRPPRTAWSRDLSRFAGTAPEPSGPPERPGRTWRITDAVTEDADAGWVQPAGTTVDTVDDFQALAGVFENDRAARDAYTEILAFLPELARDLVLYPLAGNARGSWESGPADGLGPKTLLLTLLAGPGGTTCQFALDVTRTNFVPAREYLPAAVADYPAGLVMHMRDLVALMDGEAHPADVAAVAAQAWSNTGPADVVLDRLCDVFGTVARPDNVAGILKTQASRLISDWAMPYLLHESTAAPVRYGGRVG